ncbi:hypothetical protein HDU82_007381 [Entophlyctis luteolus]|nr:hypothetical protein HDU82_007381 [Entophlyctis luteolus]
MLFTLGMMIVLILSLPLSMLNMANNISVQIGKVILRTPDKRFFTFMAAASFVCMLLICAEWLLQSMAHFNKITPLPAVGMTKNFAHLLGPIILNFSCTIFVPSWINVKKKSVNAQRSVWITMFTATAAYILLGIIPALAFENIPSIIQTFQDPTQIQPVWLLLANRVTCGLFAVAMLLPSIPISFIAAECNLVQNFVLDEGLGWGPRFAWWATVKFACYVAPWLLCIPMQTGSNIFANFMGYTGVLFVGPANFVMPFLMYLKCLRFRKEYNSSRTLTEHQTKLLKQIHSISPRIIKYLDTGETETLPFAGVFKKAATLCRRNALIPTTSRSVKSILSSTSRSRSAEPEKFSKTSASPKFSLTIDRVTDVISPGATGTLTEKTLPKVCIDGEFEGGQGDISESQRLSRQKTSSVFASKPASRRNTGLLVRMSISVPSIQEPRGNPGKDHTDLNEEKSTKDDEFWLNETVPDPEVEMQKSATVRKANAAGRRGTGLWSHMSASVRSKNDHSSIVPSKHTSIREHSVNMKVKQDVSRADSYRSVKHVGEDCTFENLPKDRATEDSPKVQIAGESMDTIVDIPSDLLKTNEHDTHSHVTDESDYIDLTGMHLRPADGLRGDTVDIFEGNRTFDSKAAKRKQSLPTEPNFVSKTFRAVPAWMPIRGRSLAVVLLAVTSVLSVVVVGLQAYASCGG